MSLTLIKPQPSVWKRVVAIAGGVGTIGILIGAYEVFTNKAEAAGAKAAQAIIDAALPGVKADVGVVTKRHEDLHEDFRQHVITEEKHHERLEKKVDALLLKQGIHLKENE